MTFGRYAAVIELLDRAIASRRQPTEVEAKAILRTIGFESPSSVACDTIDAVAAGIERLRAPFVVKIVSSDIPHKTEVGGVIFPLHDVGSAVAACRDALARVRALRSEAQVDGFLVEEYRPAFPEWLLCASANTAVGPVVTFGLGGVHTELLSAVESRLAPLRPRDIDGLIDESPLRKVLCGYRGRPAIDRQLVRDAIARLSDFICAPDVACRVDEIELNPIAIGADGVFALDALLLLKGDER